LGIRLIRYAAHAPPTDWEAIRASALIHLRLGDADQSLRFAKSLATVAPWRAESYDWLGYVAQQLHQADLVAEAKQRADEIFAKETQIFEDLRVYLDRGIA
jgi:hypothetical protein